MKKVFVWAIALTGMMAAFSSCTRDPDLSNVAEVKYSVDVQRILSANCNFDGCHGGGHNEGSLTTYDAVMSFGDVKAGNAHRSKLYRVITNRSYQTMPPSGYSEVSAADIKLLYIWIEQGAKNN
jgi:uncharacterized membrane protein